MFAKSDYYLFKTREYKICCESACLAGFHWCFGLVCVVLLEEEPGNGFKATGQFPFRALAGKWLIGLLSSDFLIKDFLFTVLEGMILYRVR